MCEKLRKLQSLKGKNSEDTALNIFIETGSYDIPVNIEDILEKFKIPISSKDFSQSESLLLENHIPERIQGQVHVQEENIDIYYNPNHFLEIGTQKERKRFTLAHELAHCILHASDVMAESGYIDYYRTDGVEDEKEIEANILAGAILMPKDVIIKLYQVCRKDKSLLETIESLSIVFEVSRKVIKARLDYLGLSD